MPQGSQNQQLSSMIERFTFQRTGIVITVNPFFAQVDVGETVIPAAFVRQSRPVAGDVVVLNRQGASWFVLGTSSASGENEVVNSSFEEVDEASRPTDWIIYNDVGVSTWESVPAPEEAVDGDRVLEVLPVPGGTRTSIIYSRPMTVVTGQLVELSVYANGFYPSDNPTTTDVQLRALWFDSATDLYPTTIAADTTVATVTNIAETETMRSLSGTATVPALATFMRLGIRTVATTNAGAHYDFATARVIG